LSGNKSVSTVEDAPPVSDAEADVLFAGIRHAPGLVLAVSGGPDSTALMVLAAAWCRRHKDAPGLTAVTVDHGLRPEARQEARSVKALAKELGVAHRTLRWSGPKPTTGLQARARATRYRLLADAARKLGATCVVTAHTLDDQGETVLLRLARGSGISGLAAMARVTPLGETLLVRPFLDVPKARLIATVRAAGIAAIEDPSNTDPRFTRARLRSLMPGLVEEGLGPERLARLARRVRRAEAAIEATVDAAVRFALEPWPGRGPIAIRLEAFATLPAEIALRLIGRAIALVGDEGPVELGKLEALMADFAETPAGFRRTLAGALVTVSGERILLQRAPPRRHRGKSGGAKGSSKASSKASSKPASKAR
jgi:tRNA(Ile)-lysidine synthase